MDAFGMSRHATYNFQTTLLLSVFSHVMMSCQEVTAAARALRAWQCPPKRLGACCPRPSEFCPDGLRRLAQTCPWPTRRSGWTNSVREIMKQMGYVETTEPWVWNHPHTRPLSPKFAAVRQQPNSVLQHELRLAWRYQNYYLWRSSARRDATACQNVQVTAERLAALKTCVLTSHVIAILTGAAVSPQAYQVMSGVEQFCPFCQAPNATHSHVMWNCLSNSARNLTPCDQLQERLGWPGGANPAHDDAVLEHMARVRAAVRDLGLKDVPPPEDDYEPDLDPPPNPNSGGVQVVPVNTSSSYGPDFGDNGLDILGLDSPPQTGVKCDGSDPEGSGRPKEDLDSPMDRSMEGLEPSTEGLLVDTEYAGVTSAKRAT
eukprot:s1018_g12.t1